MDLVGDVGKSVFALVDVVLGVRTNGHVHELLRGLIRNRAVWRDNSTAYRFVIMPDLFAPDLILPAQYRNLRESVLQQRGEIRLLYAVLQDAIECFQNGVGAEERRRLRLAQEAEQWLFADDTQWPFSFLNICLVLDLDPPYLRRKLLQWRTQQVAQRTI